MADILTHPRGIAPLVTRRSQLLGFEVNGRLTAVDIAWMNGCISHSIEEHETVDIVLVAGTIHRIDFAPLVCGPVFRDHIRVIAPVRRYAVVGAPGWAKALLQQLDPITHIHVRTFELANEVKAWAWMQDG
jgi:hypothetical protein